MIMTNKSVKYCITALLVLVCYSASAQNGKIIEQTKFDIPDSLVNKYQQVIPGIRLAIDSVNFYRITYLSDGLKVKGYLAIPKREALYPVVIFNRGGNQEFGKITDAGFVQNLAVLCSQGYLVVASQYRGTDGGEGKEEFGGSDVNDVINLVPLLGNLKQADTSRIGMFGWSRGGMMTYLTLTKTTRIKAAVVGSGLTDLFRTLESRPDFDSLWQAMIPGYATQKKELLKQRSATYFANKINKTTPLLIFQGTADWRVPTNQVLEFVNKLYECKQPFRFILYEGGQHSLIEHRDDFYTQLIGWFNTYLRDKKPWPSLELHGN
ncbi:MULTISPECIES: alpha/beta hydrolase family protein [Niastella]|uniref:S9 family peptidase n=1 Tax=Niastella soli TaxID=2821487 RepID=A0ABS3YW36_9BACT|nr:prolyl oligopeptidase family serine peptidase [Niastella soli]MBO9202142.1 S9 family peptidase [Niastella soli]